MQLRSILLATLLAACGGKSTPAPAGNSSDGDGEVVAPNPNSGDEVDDQGRCCCEPREGEQFVLLDKPTCDAEEHGCIAISICIPDDEPIDDE